MTHPMTDERLDELRKLANLTDQEDHWWALHNETELEAVSIDDLRSLLARLDADEELIREVAQWDYPSSDVLAKCRSYLR